jgi:acyl-CoA hydrolase
MTDIQKRMEPLRIVEMVFPNTTNHYGTMFGGKVLELMDRAAFLAATRFSNQAMVTASTEHIDFFVPIKHGNLIELVAKVIFTGNSSLSIKVDLYSENPIQKSRVHASQGYFHMVAVDENGRPTSIPKLIVSTEEERADWKLMEELRASRRKRRMP